MSISEKTLADFRAATGRSADLSPYGEDLETLELVDRLRKEASFLGTQANVSELLHEAADRLIEYTGCDCG